MSGLAGFVAREPVHPELTEKLDAFRHVNRIPGMRMLEQHWVGPGCVLFNSQTGLLPHHSEIHAHDSLTGTHLLVEGEVLNAEELQEQVGITHSEEGKASSPLEGLIHLFLKSGPSFIGQFQGEFAVAVYEEKQRCLHLFTDHLSTKSIFYLVDREGFFFSSEKKSILAACASAVSLDPLGLLQIVAMHHNLHDRTTISEIKRLTPASHLRFENGQVLIRRYRRLGFHDGLRGASNVQLAEAWAEILARSVRMRIRGKKRLMLFLSGGLDSRAVACAFPRKLRPIFARTHGYKDSMEVRCASKIAGG